jgi:uncharacterized protein DUF6644
MQTLATLAEALEESSVGSTIAGSRLLFPIIEGTHLISLSLAVGLIFLTDLRLLGLFLRHVPLEDFLRQLRPYVVTGIVLVFISGALLVWAEASEVIFTPSFPLKMILILAGGINALYFEFVIAKSPDVRADPPILPRSARAAAWGSISIWVLVIICGRLIAYVTHWP